MRTATHRSVGQTLTDDQGREFDLPIVDTFGDPSWTALVDDLPDGKVLVSYLVTDPDGAQGFHPLNDCEGLEYVILESQRDADALSERLNSCATCGETADFHEPANYYEDDFHEFVPNEDAIATRKGQAFFFEKYEHGQVRYALRGESSQVDRQWDVTPVAGWLKVPADFTPPYEDVARNILQEYTDWCNGNVYGIVHAWYRAEGDDWVQDGNEEACWGYIGDYAETEMRSEHEHYKTRR